MNNIAPGAQATLDQLGRAALDAIFLEEQHRNPQAEALMRRVRNKEITESQYVDEITALFADDKKGMVDFLLNGLTDSARRKEAVEKYVLARQMVEAPVI